MSFNKNSDFFILHLTNDKSNFHNSSQTFKFDRKAEVKIRFKSQLNV